MSVYPTWCGPPMPQVGAPWAAVSYAGDVTNRPLAQLPPHTTSQQAPEPPKDLGRIPPGPFAMPMPNEVQFVSGVVGSSKDMNNGFIPPDDSEDGASSSEEDYMLPVQVSQANSPNEPLQVQMTTAQAIGVQVVQSAQNNAQGNKIGSKYHACLYCKKFRPSITRHLSRKHAKEPEVANILQLPKHSQERRSLWGNLVNKGDFQHNYTVLDTTANPAGVPVVTGPKYLKAEEVMNEPLVQCPSCKGYFKKKMLHRHILTCGGDGDGTSTIAKGEAVRQGLLLLANGLEDTEFYDKVLLKMKDDAVKSAIQKDPRIMEFGKQLHNKFGGEAVHYVSQKMRELGRLTLQVNALCPVLKCIDDCLDPNNWEILVSATKQVAGFNVYTGKYKTPSLALKIGYSLQACAKNLETDALGNIHGTDEHKRQKALKFLELYQSHWEQSVSSKALSTLAGNKRAKKQSLPLVEDVIKLNNHLDERAKVLMKRIAEDRTESCYSDLAQVALAKVVMFNRNRSGETQRLLLSSVNEAQNMTLEPEQAVMSNLNRFEQQLVKTHGRLETRGNRGGKVAILLTKDMRAMIDTLLLHRNCASVESAYVFARPRNAQYPYRGIDCLRRFAEECRAQYPKLLTSTRLRKQMSALTQVLVLNLNDCHNEILYTFQQYDIRITREFYSVRLPLGALEILKISKIIHRVNNGSIRQYKGKDFDEIEFDEDDFCEPDDGTSDSDEQPSFNSPAMAVPVPGQGPVPIPGPVDTTPTTSRKRVKKEKRKREIKKVPWTREETQAVQEHMSPYLQARRCPGKSPCEEALRDPRLASRDWRGVKYHTKNLIVSIVKQEALAARHSENAAAGAATPAV